MARRGHVLALVALVSVAACEEARRPLSPATPEPTLAVGGQPASKIDPAVLAALQRGESPAVIVSLATQRPRALDQRRANARAAQDAVLRNADAQALRVRRRFATIPAFSATITTRGELQRIAAHPLVRHVALDGAGTGLLDESVPLVRADLRHARGNGGAGVTVAILDTGIDTDHPDLANAVAGQACFGDDDGDTSNGTGFCPGGGDREVGAGSAEDDAGHGTHVSGIVASDGTVSSPGMAPDAGIVAIKVLNDCSFAGCFAFTSEVIAALDYILDTPALGVRVVNMSLGTNALYDGACDAVNATTQAFGQVVDDLRDDGVIVFASSGNNGSSTQMGLPACLTNVVSVGSVDVNDNIAATSNSNATTDMLAPGVSILSLAIGGGTTTASGTSMASPHAAGCAALLIDAGDAATPDDIETRLETSSVQLTDADNDVTLPRLDCSPDGNQAPLVGADNATVTVDEGTLATNTGTYSDPDGDAVTLGASSGSVNAAAGVWSWSLATVDGPADGRTVTITATDALGSATPTNFTLVVDNVAPTVAAGSNATVISNQSFAPQPSFSDPGVIDHPWGWTVDWGDGTQSTGSTNAQGAFTVPSRTFCAAGQYTVRVDVQDKDGDTGTDDLTLTVTYVPVTIDVTPAELPNSVSLRNRGLLPVAILGSATLDVRTVAPATVRLGNESGTDTPVARRTNGTYYAVFEDVNRDGRTDLVLHFDIPTMRTNGDLTMATTSVALRGFLADGCTNVRGTAPIRVVP